MTCKRQMWEEGVEVRIQVSVLCKTDILKADLLAVQQLPWKAVPPVTRGVLAKTRSPESEMLQRAPGGMVPGLKSLLGF